MKRAGALPSRATGRIRTASRAICGAALLFIAACSLAGPSPSEYVLGTMPPAMTQTVRQTALPIVEIRRVQLPDYLDTTDMLERRGNQLVASKTSRWGERLSLGVTRALTASLAARLPGMAVTSTPPLDRPARQIQIDLAAFEAREDRQVVLVARWTILDGASRQTVASEQASLMEPIDGGDDRAVVAAMSHVIDRLAERVADGL